MKVFQGIQRKSLILLLCVAGAAVAAGVSIDGRAAPYRNLSNVRGTSINTMTEIRIAGLSQAAANYRLLHGPSSLPAGSSFRMTWPNGSSEGAAVNSAFSSMGSVPIPGSQQPGPTPPCQDCPPTQPE